MSVGMILLTATAILVFFGAAQRVLDKMYLSDRAALLLIAAMFFGTLIPNIKIGFISISIGGAIIPVSICAYILSKADTGREQALALLGSAITGLLIYGLSAIMPAEPEAIQIDPMHLYGVIAGLTAYILNRSRRGAFVCGVLGVFWADAAVGIINRFKGIEQQLILGGGGVFDAMIISGILGVLLSELLGELVERLSRGTNPPKRSAVSSPINRKDK